VLLSLQLLQEDFAFALERGGVVLGGGGVGQTGPVHEGTVSCPIESQFPLLLTAEPSCVVLAHGVRFLLFQLTQGLERVAAGVGRVCGD